MVSEFKGLSVRFKNLFTHHVLTICITVSETFYFKGVLKMSFFYRIFLEIKISVSLPIQITMKRLFFFYYIHSENIEIWQTLPFDRCHGARAHHCEITRALHGIQLDGSWTLTYTIDKDIS